MKPPVFSNQLPPFEATAQSHGLSLSRQTLKTVQINIGKLCNQACHHCHVEAGPKCTENMEAKTVDRLLYLLDRAPGVDTIDITGGAPELNPHFRRIVTHVRGLGKSVIDRCNLTVFYEKGQKDLPEFLAEQRVKVVASLPCYSEKNVDLQRGKGVFAKSIRALKKLNELGYGIEGTGLELSLVYNPVGAFLPPPQEKLQRDYKARLRADFGIEFNHLFTITNMPIKRFLEQLRRARALDAYMETLVNHFNPQAAESIMCRTLVSISWDGRLYDCDFNQMLEMPVPRAAKTLWDIESFSDFDQGIIAFAAHCYGCTAGNGSSCTGSLTSGA